MSKKSLILIAILLVVAVVGFLVWNFQDTRAKAAKLESEILKELSAEDIGLILKSQVVTDPQTGTTLKENAEARQVFLKNLRGILAMAAQARREGLAEEPNFKVNVEYKKNILLKSLYMVGLDKEQLKAFFAPEAIQAVWSNPKNEAQFSRDIETMKAIQKVYSESRETALYNSRLEGENLEKARKEWAVTKIFSDKAKAEAEFIQKPEVQLRLKIVEAGILASDYLNKHWRQDVKANDAEIKAYLAAHSEYDLGKKREKAEMILRRAKAGEDFSKLAAEFSEDRPTKSKGGLYKNVGKDILWAEVESAALALEKGQIADRLVESDKGFHIVKLEDKQIKKEKDGSQTVEFSVRHILLQNTFEEPNSDRTGIPPPFMKAEEIAKAEVEKEKYEAVVAELVKRNQITLPDDFAVELPEKVEADKLKTLGISTSERFKKAKGEENAAEKK